MRIQLEPIQSLFKYRIVSLYINNYKTTLTLYRTNSTFQALCSKQLFHKTKYT